MSIEVLCLKLTNGDEIIGRLTEKLDPEAPLEMLTLKSIRQVGLQPVGEGKFAAALMPWLVSNVDTAVPINVGLHTVAVFRPTAELEAQYLEGTGGIKVVKSSIITG